MNLLATLLLSQFLALGSTSNTSSVVWFGQDDLLQEIGRFIGGAIRGATGEDEPRVMQAMPAQDGAKPAERDRKELNDRMTAFARAYEAWVMKWCELTTEQQTKLKELIDAKIVGEVEKYGKKPDPNRQNQMLAETLPLLFTKPSGLAPDFQKELVAICKKDLLTEEQIGRLDTALKEREGFQSQSYLVYIVSILDKELFLTADQRTALVSELGNRKTPIRHPMYAFQPQVYYLPYESMSAIVPAKVGKGILEPTQTKRLQDLSTEQQGGQQLVFQTSSGREEWDRQIAEACASQRERYLNAAAVRVTYYEKEMQLSSEEVDHLSIAGKGATIRALGDWKDATRLTIEQMEQQMAQMGGNFGFGAQGMDAQTIDQNDIWTDAVSAITQGASEDRLKQRLEANRIATAQAVLAMLDEELWLTSDQREPLQKLVLKSLPAADFQNPYDQYMRDLILVIYPLMKVPEKSRTEVLADPQKEVWTQMQSYFKWQKANNYVEIPLRNQGGSFSFSLAP